MDIVVDTGIIRVSLVVVRIEVKHIAGDRLGTGLAGPAVNHYVHILVGLDEPDYLFSGLIGYPLGGNRLAMVAIVAFAVPIIVTELHKKLSKYKSERAANH